MLFACGLHFKREQNAVWFVCKVNFSPLLEMFLCVSAHKVLDGSESQYSGMQIGTLQDEEDEGAAPPSQEEPSEPPFLQSALGMFAHADECTSKHRNCDFDYGFHLCMCFVYSTKQASSLRRTRSQPAGFG